MKSMRRLIFVLGLAAASAAACGGGRATPAKLGTDDKAAIASGPDGALTEFTSELEKLVAEGDIGAIETRWLLADDLAGCTLGKKADSADEIAKFLEKHMDEFRGSAPKNMGEPQRGDVLGVNSWTQSQPELKNKLLKGDACTATAFGRINIIVKPAKAPPAVIEHRFNALYVNGEWKLFRYLPGTPNCKGKQASKWIGCKKLKEAGGGAAEAAPAGAQVAAPAGSEGGAKDEAASPTPEGAKDEAASPAPEGAQDGTPSAQK